LFIPKYSISIFHPNSKSQQLMRALNLLNFIMSVHLTTNTFYMFYQNKVWTMGLGSFAVAGPTTWNNLGYLNICVILNFQ